MTASGEVVGSPREDQSSEKSRASCRLCGTWPAARSTGAAVIRRGIAELGDRYRAEVWAWWNNNAGIWEVNFERLDGGPTAEEFTAAIARHLSLRDHHQAIAVATEAGAALRWAPAPRC